MKLLLDTHTFIWWDDDQTKLSAGALAACKSPTNSLHLSLASVWEMQIKIQLGKLVPRLSLADVLRDEQQRNGLQIEPVTLEDILGLSQLPALHRDPFDRLLISQALRGDFHLVSHDAEIGRYSAAVLW
ncbi:MAG: type II toxin-antitoxin system VapC family toxin [Verrucomicrobiota bacterium]|nr:type II toxin-antitoxin system VapC family toxin [Verrucomicrobiota bacterium]